MRSTVARLCGWAVIAVVIAVGCGEGRSVPPLPDRLRSFSDEPVQEFACASCHGPGGRAENVPAGDATVVPPDHP